MFYSAYNLVPLLVHFVAGVGFLCVGFVNLWRIRSIMRRRHHGIDNTSKMTQLMSKIGIFSVLYIVPAFFVLMVLLYEQHYRPLWEKSQLCNCAENLDLESKPEILFFPETLSSFYFFFQFVLKKLQIN